MPGISSIFIQPNGINDEGEIVGNYDRTESPNDPADALLKNGFYRAANGTLSVQYENAADYGCNKQFGVIVGYYVVDNDRWFFAALKKKSSNPSFHKSGDIAAQISTNAAKRPECIREICAGINSESGVHPLPRP
jgi:hypothetical protein